MILVLKIELFYQISTLEGENCVVLKKLTKYLEFINCQYYDVLITIAPSKPHFLEWWDLESRRVFMPFKEQANVLR